MKGLSQPLNQLLTQVDWAGRGIVHRSPSTRPQGVSVQAPQVDVFGLGVIKVAVAEGEEMAHFMDQDLDASILHIATGLAKSIAKTTANTCQPA